MSSTSSSGSTLPGWLSDALGAFAAGDTDGFMKIYAPEAVHEFPFAAEGQARRLEGRDEIAAYMRQLPGRIRFGSFENIRVREIGDEVIMEADGHHQRLDGTPFNVRYVSFITLRDGLVSYYRDYMGPLSS
jgi:ketosteroid isomerase-like protein